MHDRRPGDRTCRAESGTYTAPGDGNFSQSSDNLKTRRDAVAATTGGGHSCAVVEDGTLKCWGNNTHGQLGLGGQANRGDQHGEMGNHLAPIDLGTGRTPTSITAGQFHTSALLDNDTVKCWGHNELGELGQGDANDRGDTPGEMGDNLTPIDFGTGRTATAISGSGRQTCALLDDGTVKCWGDNTYGQLGYGDIVTRGDEPGEMGDNLAADRPRHRTHRNRDHRGWLFACLCSARRRHGEVLGIERQRGARPRRHRYAWRRAG